MEKEIIKQKKIFQEMFSNSDFWLNSENYPNNYKTILKFLEKSLLETIKETERKCEEEYQVFIQEMRKENLIINPKKKGV